MSSNNFTWGHLMKIEWLVTDVTAVGSPAKTECAILVGGDLGWVCFWPIPAVFVVAELLCDVRTSS